MSTPSGIGFSSTSSQNVTNAAYPFNKTAADAILRSADNVDFWVRRSILAEASCIFEDMLSLPQPPPGAMSDNEFKDGLPVIQVTENSCTLDKLLRLCYPTEDPKLNSLDELRSVLDAAMKYMMEEATSLLRRRLVKLGQAQPLRAFAIACRLDLAEEADSLAPLAYSVHGSFVEELRDISAGVYYRVSHYMIRPPENASPKRRSQRYSYLPWSSPVLHPKLNLTPSPSDHLPKTVEHIPPPPELLSSPTADVILRSGDGLEFRLHSTILSFASPVLRQLVQDHAALQPEDPAITLPEYSHILTTLLQHVYPLARPHPSTSFPVLKELLLAAQKYDVAPAISAFRACLLTFLSASIGGRHESWDKDALRIFALAHRLGFAGERNTAARALLRLSKDDLRSSYVEELEDISAAAYFRLLEYHDRCGQAAAACVLAHALAYSGTASAPPSPHRPATLLLAGQPPGRRRNSASSEDRGCKALKRNSSSALSGSPASTTSSLAFMSPAAIAMTLCARRSHTNVCHVVLDDTSDTSWTRFRTHSTPRWWIMYVYKLGVVLRQRPHARIALDAGLRQRAMSRAAECECCRTYFLPGFVEYAESLASEIEKAVTKVTLEIE